jgi:Cu2+-exporting ATPase
MIGDGANDSLAFDAATCRGTPAIERGLLEHRADFFFLGRGLSGIRKLLEAGHVRRRAIKYVLGFAVLYNVVVVGVALAGRMNPLVAAVVMPASALVTLAIATWSMRRL